MSERNTTLVLGWVNYHTRNEGLAEELGGETVYPIWGPRGSALVAVARYFVQGAKTIGVLARRRPRRLVVMVPPFPALLICTLYAKLTRAVIIGDVHTYPLVSDVWRPFLPATAWLLKQGSGAIVTNEANADILRGLDVPTLMMHDTPRLVPGRDKPVDNAEPTIVFPASFDPDEPVIEVLDAARSLPHVRFKVTGQDNREVLAGVEIPSNVTLTGYVSRADYEDLLRTATAVCSLTTLDDCMQQAGYEAMGFGRPLVTSDSSVLREYFGSAAVYAAPTSTSIAAAIEEAVTRAEELHEAMVELGEVRVADRATEIERLERIFSGSEDNGFAGLESS